MARPRRQTYPLKTYLDDNKSGDISNNADTQRKPAWKPIIDGLIVTILTDDYIPPIILAEEDSSQLDIVDGGSRTAAFMMFRYGNHKISSSVENSVISYKKKNKEEDGNIIWEDATFDIRGKTYDQLPDELKKKFNGYQLETVIHENCDKKRIATYIKRYNEHSSMNTNQKAFTYIDKFAGRINRIVESGFFINNKVYTDSDKNKGVIERIVVETVMCMKHFDNWKTQPKTAYKYLNDNSTENEFDDLESNLHRLENIITSDIMDIFNKKDSFIFLTLFDKFTKLGMDDLQFAEFLREFKNNLRESSKNQNGLLFDEIDKDASTKDKQVVSDKLDMLERLMLSFLQSNESQEEETVSNESNITTTENESFIADVLNMDLEKVIEEMEVYDETLDSLAEKTIRDGSKLLNVENRKSLLALVAYSYERDMDLDEWMEQYAAKNNMYFPDQRKNFLHMKKDFINYIETKENKEKVSV